MKTIEHPLQLLDPVVNNKVNKMFVRNCISIKGETYITVKILPEIKNIIKAVIIKKRKVNGLTLEDLENWKNHTIGMVEAILSMADAIEATTKSKREEIIVEYEKELCGIK